MRLALEDLGTEHSGPSTSPSGRSPPAPRPTRRFPAATPAAGSGVRLGFKLTQALVQAGGQPPRASCAKTDGQVGGARPGLQAEPRPGAETSLRAWKAGRAARRCRGRGRTGCPARVGIGQEGRGQRACCRAWRRGHRAGNPREGRPVAIGRVAQGGRGPHPNLPVDFASPATRQAGS